MSRREDLNLDGMIKLTAPGMESNWLDWAFLMETAIKASTLKYVMLGALSSPLPPSYDDDKARICSILTRYVAPVNLVILRRHKDDLRGMWAALKAAHERNTAGSRMFWLEKLVSFSLESSDIPAELDRAEAIAEWLKALVSALKPLSVDEILVMVLGSKLPEEFKPTITPLLQRPSVVGSEVISEVREECIRMTLAPSRISVNAVSSSFKDDGKGPSTNSSRDTTAKRLPFCTIFRRRVHETSKCPKAGYRRDELAELREKMARLEARLGSGDSTAPSTKATVTTTLDPTANESSNGSDSNFSYNSNVTASLSSAHTQPPCLIVDSGCTTHMVPGNSSVQSMVKNSTCVHLADGSTIDSTSKGLLDLGFSDQKPRHVLVVPKLRDSLLSVSKLADEGLWSVFNSEGHFFVRNPSFKGEVMGHAKRRDNLYVLDESISAGGC